uniref:Uncharacterized protein n=1 Tax=Eutreptiella gymnastica TaxID=73025 RepID=A0A7S4D1L6_9EUGL|mmetsp:Transcript_102805/g.174199  ORF Transcript_102805/g.174199 Transcript_102805/m.174199 type:complete len:110 (-) Transcript_102805:384-713(-)
MGALSDQSPRRIVRHVAAFSDIPWSCRLTSASLKVNFAARCLCHCQRVAPLGEDAGDMQSGGHGRGGSKCNLVELLFCTARKRTSGAKNVAQQRTSRGKHEEHVQELHG